MILLYKLKKLKTYENSMLHFSILWHIFSLGLEIVRLKCGVSDPPPSRFRHPWRFSFLNFEIFSRSVMERLFLFEVYEMEKITIAKALKTIVLPDGKTVHEGDEFVYNHDFENCGEFEIVGEQNSNKAQEGNEGKDISIDELSVEEMKEIRLKAKDLKIANWHTKSIARLLAEIAEAEAKQADGISPEVVVSEMENTTEAPAPQQPDNTPLV